LQKRVDGLALAGIAYPRGRATLFTMWAADADLAVIVSDQLYKDAAESGGLF
jgi:hypothetical protein